ncbi:MAG TPA: tetratricopeptide repeat protein [Gemmatimonadales bacterium]|nr:tetratricopeptide repeat protein [Gemmatimonadales bacterium]
MAAALVLTCAPRLASQTPDERARLDSIRLSFGAYTDTTALISLERARIDVARTRRDDPWIHMELGWLALRLAELSGGASRHYMDAAGEFQWASELRPDWAWAWYWLGVAELGIGEADLIAVENIRQVLGIDYLSQASRAFARAIEADPGFAEALVNLAATALRQRIRARIEVALSALRQAESTEAGRHPRVLLMRGRLERRQGDNEAALGAFQRMLEAGGDSGVALVEQARTLGALQRRDSALAAYARALGSRPTDSLRAELRRDVRWIASPEELVRFDSLAPDSLGSWLTRFWSRRDVEDGWRPGDRLLEQFRRYVHSVQNFSLVSPRRARDVAFGFRDTTQDELDDRGVIYMRHGEPHQRARYSRPGGEPSESWLYRRAPRASDLIFHFSPLGDLQDYRLLESLSTVCAADRECYAARAGMADVYARLERGTVSRMNVLADERFLLRESIRQGTTSDSYVMRFDRDLRPIVSTFTVADGSGRPELHLVFAIPGARLQPRRVEDGVAYFLSLRLVVFDDAGGAVASVDTVRVFRARERLGDGSFLSEQVTVNVPPGSYRYHFVVEEVQRNAGAIAAAQPVEIPRLDAGFAVSDVVLGREGSGLSWRSPDGIVPLNPLQRFPEAVTATLYYQIHGLPALARVATRVRVRTQGSRSIFRRLFGGGRGAEVAYETVTETGGRTLVRQTLGLAGLGRGRYQIEVTLTDPVSGRTVVRRAPFEIVAGPGRAP